MQKTFRSKLTVLCDDTIVNDVLNVHRYVIFIKNSSYSETL